MAPLTARTKRTLLSDGWFIVSGTQPSDNREALEIVNPFSSREFIARECHLAESVNSELYWRNFIERDDQSAKCLVNCVEVPGGLLYAYTAETTALRKQSVCITSQMTLVDKAIRSRKNTA